MDIEHYDRVDREVTESGVSRDDIGICLGRQYSESQV